MPGTPWEAIIGGAAALPGLFSHPHVHDPNIAPFSFTPNENDPELAMLRRRYLLEASRTRAGTVNEIGRAGLLGSGASFDMLGANDTNTLAGLSDINNEAFTKQRLEALQLYRDAADFQRQKALTEYGGSSSEHGMALSGLGQIGSSLGMSAEEAQRQARMRSLFGNTMQNFQYPQSPLG